MSNQQNKLHNKIKINSDKIRSLINEIENKIEDYQYIESFHKQHIIKKKIENF